MHVLQIGFFCKFFCDYLFDVCQVNFGLLSDIGDNFFALWLSYVSDDSWFWLFVWMNDKDGVWVHYFFVTITCLFAPHT